MYINDYSSKKYIDRTELPTTPKPVKEEESDTDVSILDVRLNSYDVSEYYKDLAPSTDNPLNLDDYYNAGFKTNEQNEEEAAAIEEDISELYGIDLDEANAQEKLAIVFDTLLNQEENQALSAFCEKNELLTTYNSENANQFVSDVELAMAQMSHDGSSVGDLIKLPNVDFSSLPLPEPEASDSDKNRIIINNAVSIEFDDAFSQEGNTYTGTVDGNKVAVTQQEDGSCVVQYYDGNSENSKLSTTVTYSSDKTTTYSTYDLDENGIEVNTSSYTVDINGEIISKSYKTENGSIEIQSNGNDKAQIERDENGNIIKYAVHAKNENGIYSVTSYSGKDMEDIISEDRFIKFQQKDNVSKFKFETGNAHSIEFVEDNNSISANISKGSLKTTTQITRNADGTYTYNDEVYQSIEDVAVKLNGTTIKEDATADGQISVSKQGYGVGDCWIITAVNALSYSESGQKVLSDCISVKEDGSVDVTFKALNRTYNITPEELSTDRYADGDKDVVALELATTKAFNDIQYGNLRKSDSAPDYLYYTSSNALNDALNSDGFVISGNYPEVIWYMLTGKENSNPEYDNREQTRSWFNEIEQDKETMLSLSSFKSGNCVIERPAVSGHNAVNVNGLSLNDAFGNPVKVATGHAYAVKDVNTKEDGSRTITIVNPWDSSDEIILNENDALNTFEVGYRMRLKDNESYPTYYY